MRLCVKRDFHSAGKGDSQRPIWADPVDILRVICQKNNNQKQGTEKNSDLHIYEANVRCNSALFVSRLQTAEHTPTAVGFFATCNLQAFPCQRAFYYIWADDFHYEGFLQQE